MQVSQIFILSEVKLLTEAVKLYLSEHGIDTYVHDNTNEFAYLIEDLRPALIIVDERILEKFEDVFWFELQKAQFDRGQIYLLKDERKSMLFDIKFMHKIPMPLNLDDLLKIVQVAGKLH